VNHFIQTHSRKTLSEISMKSSKLSLKNKIIHSIIAIPFLLFYIPLVCVNVVFLTMSLALMFIHQRINYLIGLHDMLYFLAVSRFNDKRSPQEQHSLENQ